MPKGSKVEEVFQALKRQGHSVESAARIAQAQTGQALATGKPPKHPSTGPKAPVHDNPKFRKKK